jgi:hypothetical protein
MCEFGSQLREAVQFFVAEGGPFDALDVCHKVRDICGPGTDVPRLEVKYETYTLFERGGMPGYYIGTKNVEGLPHSVIEYVPTGCIDLDETPEEVEEVVPPSREEIDSALADVGEEMDPIVALSNVTLMAHRLLSDMKAFQDDLDSDDIEEMLIMEESINVVDRAGTKMRMVSESKGYDYLQRQRERLAGLQRELDNTHLVCGELRETLRGLISEATCLRGQADEVDACNLNLEAENEELKDSIANLLVLEPEGVVIPPLTQDNIYEPRTGTQTVRVEAPVTRTIRKKLDEEAEKLGIGRNRLIATLLKNYTYPQGCWERETPKPVGVGVGDIGEDIGW